MLRQYKVLVDGQSCHGGELKWSLPRRADGKWIPGKWHTVRGNLSLCENGLHTTSEIAQWLAIGCSVYHAEGAGKCETDGDKTVWRKVRLLRPARVPPYWRRVEKFVASLATVPWHKQCGAIDPSWEYLSAETWHAASNAASNAARDAAWIASRDAARNASRNAASNASRDAARNASRNAAYNASYNAAYNAAWSASCNAVWSAASDAGLMCCVDYLCADLPIADEHRQHANARWEVWTRGYALLCDVNGRLYVCGTKKKEV